MLRSRQRPARPQPKSSGRKCVSSSSGTAGPRDLGTAGALPWPRPQKPVLRQPLFLETLCPSPSPRPMNTSLGRTSWRACWGRPPFSIFRPQRPARRPPREESLALQRSPAQLQRSSSTWCSGKQVCVVWAPRPALVLGTHCPGISARRAAGEGQARTLVVSQCGGLGDDLGRKNQFLAIPGHGPDGAAQARSNEGLAVH